MTTTNICTLGKRALRAALKLAKTEFESAVSLLDQHRCISYIVLYRTELQWSPELDIAVTLFVRLPLGLCQNEGRVRRDLTAQDVTPEKTQQGRQAIDDCVAKLGESGQPFAMICHVDGDEDLFDHYSGFSEDQAKELIARRLGEDIAQYVVA